MFCKNNIMDFNNWESCILEPDRDGLEGLEQGCSCQRWCFWMSFAASDIHRDHL